MLAMAPGFSGVSRGHLYRPEQEDINTVNCSNLRLSHTLYHSMTHSHIGGIVMCCGITHAPPQAFQTINSSLRPVSTSWIYMCSHCVHDSTALHSIAERVNSCQEPTYWQTCWVNEWVTAIPATITTTPLCFTKSPVWLPDHYDPNTLMCGFNFPKQQGLQTPI